MTSETPSPSASASTSAAAPAGAKIGIKGFKYVVSGPAEGGTKVTVTNNDAEAHTVTADGGKGGFDVAVLPGKSMTFAAPAGSGSFKFHCNFHGNMNGELKVT